MKDVQKTLSAAEKANLIATADASLSDAVKSVRRKMIDENYLTSATQVATLDKLLWAVKENENSSLPKVLFDNQVKGKQIEFINKIRSMFKEGWMLSRAFRFYTGGGHVAGLNSWKLKDIVRVIETQDRSDFGKLDLLENSKKTSNEKPKFKKKPTAKPVRQAGKDIPIIRSKS